MSAPAHRSISFPRLDALRGLCFLAVFFFHGFYTQDPAIRASSGWQFLKFIVFGHGDLGVNVFFVLSGFLITYLLIAERRLTGRIHVPRFWLRRVLRIWPLYYACVLFGFVLFPLLKHWGGEVPHEVADPWYFVFFASNFDPSGTPDASSLDVLWSIAVEEQFYLVWPLVLAALPVKRYPWAFGLVILGSWVFRASTTNAHALYAHTLSCIGDMATGGLAAWTASSERGLERLRRLPHWVFTLAYLLLAVVFFDLYGRMDGSPLLRVFQRTFVAVPAALIILHQCFGPVGRLSLPARGVLAAMGRISYGLYCLHIIGYLAAIQVLHRLGLDAHLWQVLLFQPAVALAVAVSMAAFSHCYYEMPFLRLKDRFAFVRRSGMGNVT